MSTRDKQRMPRPAFKKVIYATIVEYMQSCPLKIAHSTLLVFAQVVATPSRSSSSSSAPHCSGDDAEVPAMGGC